MNGSNLSAAAERRRSPTRPRMGPVCFSNSAWISYSPTVAIPAATSLPISRSWRMMPPLPAVSCLSSTSASVELPVDP